MQAILILILQIIYLYFNYLSLKTFEQNEPKLVFFFKKKSHNFKIFSIDIKDFVLTEFFLIINI